MSQQEDVHMAARPEQILWQRSLAERWNIDRQSVYRKTVAGELPPPDVLFGRRKGWYESTIEKYEASTKSAAA
jgi:predicted DNA-binding transcriptional regulator AlpA